jgi:two-component system chemotaxis response regulator CheB
METAAEVFRNKAVGIILSGANTDGSRGMKKIKEMKGTTIVQDPDCSEIKTMPLACIKAMKPDYIFNDDEIVNYIQNLEA